MIAPEWISVVINGVLVSAGVVATYTKIAVGQAIAHEREKVHTAEIAAIGSQLALIVNGESKCKLAFTKEIATLQQKTESIQVELTEEKQNRKEAIR